MARVTRFTPSASSHSSVAAAALTDAEVEAFSRSPNACDSELLSAAEKLANFGTWEIDLASKTVALSDHLFEMLQLEPQQRVALHIFWQMVAEPDRRQVQCIVENAIVNHGSFEYVAKYSVSPGLTKVLNFRSLPAAECQSAHRMAGLAIDLTAPRAGQEPRKLSLQLMNLRDQEQRRIARALHETVGQSLAALKMSLVKLDTTIGRNASLTAALHQSALRFVDDSISELRTVTYLMHPPTLDMSGLASALEWLADGFSQRSAIEVKLNIQPEFGRLPQEIEITLFRIAQEALTNVHRHSRSQTAEIQLARYSSSVLLSVRDHGVGLPPGFNGPRSRHRMGVGLAGMRERVKQMNGTLQFQTERGRGTTIVITVPIP
jgi:signal transduction histidine kinase